MRTFITLATALFATAVSANSKANAFSNPAGGYVFTVGEATTLVWNADSGSTVTLRLQYGDVTTANSGAVIASGIANDGSYTWQVPSDLAYESDYTIEIIDDQDTSNYNFLPRFTVAGATASATATTASSTSMSTATTVSSTSTSTTSASTSSTPTTMTTTSSSSSASSSSTASTTKSTSTSASTSASSTASATSVPSSNSGMVNRVSGGMLAVVAGAAILL
ncbi:cell wall protein [Penicillium canariense]|uniref:Cell wall protein n=1 Tax=Penicillium canariense TaxID=189055 RepID=A0A9W9I6F6_9EURO|nr:cell wall protein [Penicillium canariense]KAJ5166582.1 cell wall protein [Penicillium canariense]